MWNSKINNFFHFDWKMDFKDFKFYVNITNDATLFCPLKSYQMYRSNSPKLISYEMAKWRFVESLSLRAFSYLFEIGPKFWKLWKHLDYLLRRQSKKSGKRRFVSEPCHRKIAHFWDDGVRQSLRVGGRRRARGKRTFRVRVPAAAARANAIFAEMGNYWS